MLRQSCANGTRTERAVQGRDPGSIPVRTAIDVASVGPMAGDVTQSKMTVLERELEGESKKVAALEARSDAQAKKMLELEAQIMKLGALAGTL